MSTTLPVLRANLDFMPSPVPDRPGLLMRDPFQYSDVTLIFPPVLVEFLEYFDGQHTGEELRSALFELTGDLRSGEIASNMTESLQTAGFLEDETYLGMRAAREKEFLDQPVRMASHADAAYPGDTETLAATMRRYCEYHPPSPGHLIGVAAPHVSPEGGWQSYRAAYAGLQRADYADRTFVILGTSHYGEPEKFGLTRKTWATPWGEAQPAMELIEELQNKAPQAVKMEDYCIAFEHSIEFQVVFLQYLFGPNIRILPILCGAYARSIYMGGMPEDDENVARFVGSLGEIGAREGNKLLWVLGVDMAHMGRRYGDPFQALSNTGEMALVRNRDQMRIEKINAGDSRGYWDMVRENQDDLKWCGSSPFYTFMRAMPHARGMLNHYEQWNIDPQSVVSFAGMQFTV